MKEKRYDRVKIASINGKYIRLITQPLTADEIGLWVIIVIPFCDETIVGLIKYVDDTSILLVTIDKLMVCVNPKEIVGWTILRLFFEDIDNTYFQTYPEEFCIPGTFSEEGVQV